MLVFFYIVMTIFISGFMFFDGAIWGGLALLIGALLGFGGGSGMRGASYVGNRKSGAVLGLALLMAGMALVFYSDVELRVLGFEFSGDVWVFLGFAIGWLAARPEDAGIGAPSTAVESDPRPS